MKLRTLCFSLLALGALNMMADDIKVTALNSGTISWADPNTTGTYTVQWASSVSNPAWSSDWQSLKQLASTGGQITASIPMFFRVLYHPLITNDMILVPGGGQPLGPDYDFYMSRYEVTAAQFCQFLNNAQLHPLDSRGNNMVFQSNGDVRTTASAGMFDVSSSHLIYSTNLSVGQRYQVFPSSKTNHPITGVSWLGAVKYCNWLTIQDGLGESQRCYTEGYNAYEWHPSNISDSEWQLGFEIAQRLFWVNNYRGYRLPMMFSEGAGYFDENYKAAAWNGTTNTIYGYGRNSITSQYANYLSSGDPFGSDAIGTTPVGYYDGSTHSGFTTASNLNQYGIYDLCGNVSEWGTGNGYGVFDMPWNGGSWRDSYYYSINGVDVCAAQWGFALDDGPGDTYDWLGFRVVRSSVP